MIRLETVEDFEKAKKILADPKSQSHEYWIKNFGFCSGCNRLTEYFEYTSTIGEGNKRSYKTCFGCNRSFEFKYDGIKYVAGECYFSYDEQEYRVFLSESDKPELIEELERLYSRKQQIKFFKEKLEIKIAGLKREMRTNNRTIRRLAKLRT